MVTAQIATIPDRVEMLEKTVESLLPQVDQLNVMLNGHKQAPKYLYRPKVTYYYLDNTLGDAAKFYGLKNVDGYIFTCDDDMVYPPDYVETMTKTLKKYYNSVIVAMHGRIMNDKPVSNSYTDRKKAFNCRADETLETYIDIGGTGAMAWHSSTFFPDYNRITKRNMADIWVAMFANEQNIKILHVPHKGFEYLHPEDTIWDEAYYNPGPQTDLYNSF